MAAKHKIIFLFLALACFVGIILVFFFDGYMGIYDTVRIDNGQYVQTITYDQWQEQERYGYYPGVSVDRGLGVDFTYTVENHRFSGYTADVSVSLWYGLEKVADLSSGRINAPAFGEAGFDLALDPDEYLPADFPADQSYNFILAIDRDGVERRVTVYVNPGVVPKLVPPRLD